MTLMDRYVAMKDFVEKENNYVGRIASIERRGGGRHPIYGNDESAALASDAFDSMSGFLARRPPQEGESLEGYTEALARAMDESMWRDLWRFDRLRKAWYEGDFSLGSDQYDVYGQKASESWDFEIPADKIPGIVAAILERARRSGGGSEGIAAARDIVEGFGALLEGRDAGLIWAQIREKARMADSALGAVYRSGANDNGSWNPPDDYDDIKGRAKAYGAALDILEPLFRELSAGKRP